MNYHCDVLEAKLILVESLVVSIASEFIENNGKDAECEKNGGKLAGEHNPCL